MADFKQPCSEIWRLLPFKPCPKILPFVESFMNGDRFDAEHFWELVSSRAQALQHKKMPRHYGMASTPGRHSGAQEWLKS